MSSTVTSFPVSTDEIDQAIGILCRLADQAPAAPRDQKALLQTIKDLGAELQVRRPAQPEPRITVEKTVDHYTVRCHTCRTRTGEPRITSIHYTTKAGAKTDAANHNFYQHSNNLTVEVIK